MDLKTPILEIIDFMRAVQFKIDPLPKVMVDETENDPNDIFIKTGNYNNSNQTITLFVDKRHIKDILRTFCHELVHHNQYLNDPEGVRSRNVVGNLQDNPELREIERDAYEKGNLLFRWWTETK